ncbi:hypothetical protein GCM10023219_03980 [Stakelama sediminis]|uniref:Uncharacterized protein n=1 Tax=Stakelama sediminis TaxID=463200 RepID=A0A840YTZ8_9SPHN|nr:hypothetical protein [Stakelama sediminis]MBB5717111.1 hypothetical protein [Stakelama sediminis]
MMTNELYMLVRDAIRRAEEQKGRLYEDGHQSHYMALAALLALKKAGYRIEKRGD